MGVSDETVRSSLSRVESLDERIQLAIKYDTKHPRISLLRKRMESVYVAFLGDEPVYVGMGRSPNRIDAHVSAIRTNAEGWHKRIEEGVPLRQLFWVIALVDGDYQTIQHVEATLIYKLRPRGNKMGSGRGRVNFWKDVWVRSAPKFKAPPPFVNKPDPEPDEPMHERQGWRLPIMDHCISSPPSGRRVLHKPL